MAEEERRYDLRLILYGVIGSALVFLVYDVASSIVEKDPIQHILAKMFAFPLAVMVGGLAVRIFPMLHSMSNRNTAIIFAILGVISIVLFVIFQIGILNNITIKTDWPSYADSETITVSGKVNQILPNEKVSILILYPDGTIYNSTSVSLIDNSNFYEYKFNIKPLGHGTKNVFKIGAMYAGNAIWTSFEYEDNKFPNSSLSP